MAAVEFKNVSKTYSGNIDVVKSFNLHIEEGEFIVFLGPSGCGKSTTLRMLAGLEDITGGEVIIGNDLVNDMSPKDRNIAMVFQSYALYPHMSVYDNIAFALKMSGMNKEAIRKQVRPIADMLQLTPVLDRKPRSLSGGQRQRVAMGRAMVRTPEVFLFDEPLSNLDAKLRNAMRGEIKSLHKKLNKTTVYVTHDQIEAMTLADRIVVLKDGRIEQVGTPEDIYHHPVNTFVASFIGSPTMNLVDVQLVKNQQWNVMLGEKLIPLQGEYGIENENTHVVLGIRPSDIYLDASDIMFGVKLSASIITCELLGAAYELEVSIQGIKFVLEVSAEGDIPEAGDINVYLDSNKLHIFDNNSGQVINLKSDSLE
ncbi:sn-glycerol-3-phosphate ABC transporter ATP-binding protein UgpC [Vibrio sp. S17_S38]|uniref:ABC transporter ATP-binding protein n=1 Tax=Vibrio sp. S17_S38 TaxID=2720229 RepID=UPI0016804C86|nr:sn-glycerol-3-phosphate ABC transporter ATP-binding protein UgpC [Vibrio sp. S17_S38]MBD1572626.1 sn-glycerol-3-phosphate ABC transporter ATP-binding protein UgpC [Vibrio sp. S17_S38]